MLTSLPVLYVCNVDEGSAATGNDLSRKVEARAKEEGAGCVVISAKIEVGDRGAAGRGARRASSPISGLKETGLDRLIRAGYDLLHLVTYFTAGPKEARAWTITKGTKGPAAAGVIHSDFERGFIRAETIAYDDYVKYCGRGRRARRRQAAAGRQGLCRRRRRRDALPVQHLAPVSWTSTGGFDRSDVKPHRRREQKAPCPIRRSDRSPRPSRSCRGRCLCRRRSILSAPRYRACA